MPSLFIMISVNSTKPLTNRSGASRFLDRPLVKKFNSALAVMSRGMAERSCSFYRAIRDSTFSLGNEVLTVDRQSQFQQRMHASRNSTRSTGPRVVALVLQ
jgi:hypothetical protein